MNPNTRDAEAMLGFALLTPTYRAQLQIKKITESAYDFGDEMIVAT